MAYPRQELDLTTKLPPGVFTTPDPDEIDEEGFGMFRGVWRIVGGSVEYARELARVERDLAETVSRHATSAAHFDQIAYDIEGFDLDNERDYFRTIDVEEATRLRAALPHWSVLDSLELGVAGLVTTLAAVGAFPAASCRGHVSTSAWSQRPTVHFAIDEARAKPLVDHVTQAGCRLAVSGNGEHLVIVEGPSIEETMALTDRLLVDADAFLTN